MRGIDGMRGRSRQSMVEEVSGSPEWKNKKIN
jgi:hypothetical protein